MRASRDRPPRVGLNGAIRLLRDGYEFLPKVQLEAAADVAQLRLLGRRAIAVRGPQATRMFYDARRLHRNGAVPARVQKTLTGQHAVQTLDGVTHRWRKGAFLELMTPESVAALVGLVEARWRQSVPAWQRSGQVRLLDETQLVLCWAACAWAGVPLPGNEVRRRARDLAAMVDGFAAVGPRHWRARVARRRSERWIGSIVESVRDGRLEAPAGTALDVFAHLTTRSGHLVPVPVAAVELLNVVRPMVAIAGYITFAAVALHEHPEWAARLRTADDDTVLRFVHEVRRRYPFTPLLTAQVSMPFEWNAVSFEPGDLVVLDVYGTMHDERYWPRADVFDPDRFVAWPDYHDTLIPQGGGDVARGHRCAGEAATIAVVASAVRLLTREMRYTVAAQDLNIDLRRIPTFPASRFVMTEVMPMTETSHHLASGDRLLRSYLNDHLASATAAARVARRLARPYRREPVGPVLGALADDIERDRHRLLGFMAELGVPVRRSTTSGAAAAELVGRLNVSRRLTTPSPLRSVVELERLASAVGGTRACWRTLRRFAERHGRPDVAQLDHLLDRAQEQAATIEQLRARAAELLVSAGAGD